MYDKRVDFYQGHDEIAPGLQLLHIGGHTEGLQAVRVHTARGWIVLASDASHYYENMERQAPFPSFMTWPPCWRATTLLKYAESPDHRAGT